MEIKTSPSAVDIESIKISLFCAGLGGIKTSPTTLGISGPVLATVILGKLTLVLSSITLVYVLFFTGPVGKVSPSITNYPRLSMS